MLTQSQLTTLKTAMLAETDPELVSYRTNGQTSLIMDWYNGVAEPDFIIWRDAVTKDEIYANGFDWVQVDNVTEPKWRVWNEIFWSGAMNPSKPNVRAAIAEVWKGTSDKLAVQTYVLGKCKRPATRAEKLFAVGVGSVASPANNVLTSDLTEYDVTLVMQE